MVTVDPRVRAALDVGSNSIHLLVARVESGALEPLLDTSVQLGLGDVVDRHGNIPAPTRDRLVEVIAVLVAEARDRGSQDVILLGTEPLRRTSDRPIVLADVRTATGLQLLVLTHEMEAELTLLGVLAGAVPVEPTLVIDIGGGSTEAILTRMGAAPEVAVIATGSARLAAGIVGHDPLLEREVEELRREAARLAAVLPLGAPRRAIVVGGSGPNLLRLLGADARAPGAVIDEARIADGYAVLVSRPAADIATDTGLTERRIRQLGAGIALVEAALQRYGLSSAEVSDASLREGAILAADRAGSAWRERLRSLVTGGA